MILLSFAAVFCADPKFCSKDVMVHDLTQSSPWLRRWIGTIVPGGRVLDLACGSGRHTRLLLAEGYPTLSVDRDISGVEDLRGQGGCELLQADLENGPWPIGINAFAGIVVTNYLYRPNFPHLLAALIPGGILIYETFAEGNGEFGRPSNADFLLRPGELLAMVNGSARVIAFEDVYIDVPKPALVQRICAVKNGGPPRYFRPCVN